MAKLPSELVTRVIVAGCVLLICLVGYFLADRDSSIRLRLDTMGVQIVEDRLKLERCEGRIDAQGRELGELRQAVASRGERISRLETLIERNK